MASLAPGDAPAPLPAPGARIQVCATATGQVFHRGFASQDGSFGGRPDGASSEHGSFGYGGPMPGSQTGLRQVRCIAAAAAAVRCIAVAAAAGRSNVHTAGPLRRRRRPRCTQQASTQQEATFARLGSASARAWYRPPLALPPSAPSASRPALSPSRPLAFLAERWSTAAGVARAQARSQHPAAQTMARRLKSAAWSTGLSDGLSVPSHGDLAQACLPRTSTAHLERGPPPPAHTRPQRRLQPPRRAHFAGHRPRRDLRSVRAAARGRR